MTRYLTAPAAAAYLNMTARTLRELAKKGTLRGSKPAGRWLFDVADLDDYVTGGANTTDAPTLRRRRRRSAA